MHPTDEQQLTEAAQILASSETRDMYANVLATSIAGQLNAREHVSHYEPRSSEGLVTLLEHDARYDVRHDSRGLPIIRLLSAFDVSRESER